MTSISDAEVEHEEKDARISGICATRWRTAPAIW